VSATRFFPAAGAPAAARRSVRLLVPATASRGSPVILPVVRAAPDGARVAPRRMRRALTPRRERASPVTASVPERVHQERRRWPGPGAEVIGEGRLRGSRRGGEARIHVDVPPAPLEQFPTRRRGQRASHRASRQDRVGRRQHRAERMRTSAASPENSACQRGRRSRARAHRPPGGRRWERRAETRPPARPATGRTRKPARHRGPRGELPMASAARPPGNSSRRGDR
jgi:hypothetical protein